MAQPQGTDAGLRKERILPADVYPESLSRLSPLRREGLSEEGRAAYDALSRPGPDTKTVAGLQGPGGVWLRLPVIGRHINEATRMLRSEIGLDPRLTELAIIAAAREMDSQFQWTMHEPVARKVGLSEKIIDVVKHRKPVADMPATIGRCDGQPFKENSGARANCHAFTIRRVADRVPFGEKWCLNFQSAQEI